MSPPKSCAVCGDKALGYNFSAVTCESCKAFFRRNALAKKEFTCPFSQNCEITVVTRRFCQRCRLKKCLDIGMKSENIMSEEDKLVKRRKIESNRAKRRMSEQKYGSVADSTGFDTASHDSQSSFDSGKGTTVNNSATPVPTTSTQSISSTVLLEPLGEVKTDLMTGAEMVEFIVGDPDRASQAISKLMRTKTEALAALEKILNSQKDALQLISHLIAYPGDALKIISKIMNSPFNALTVFTKFMSSPTDALEIISKVVSSPQDVLQFIRNLMDCPEDALDIMNKFMNTPAEALRIINKMFNGSNQPTTSVDVHELLLNAPVENESKFQLTPQIRSQAESQSPPPKAGTGDILIHSMLSSPSSATSVPVLVPELMSETSSPINPQSVSMRPPSTSLSVSSPLTPSQTMSIASPTCSVLTPDVQYHSPTSLHSDIELPSTSAGVLSPRSQADLTNDTTDFGSEHFDIRAFIQNSFPDSGGDSLNSFESVLTEVIRIEFQAFNNLPPVPRIKQEYIQPQHNGLQSDALANMQQTEECGYSICSAQPQQPICAPSSVIMGRDLNEAEQMKLRELKLASEALYYPVDQDLSVMMMGDDRIKSEETQQYPKLLQVINLTAVAIKRLIKMAKKITVFREMCQEDQVALLKGGCTEMMIMRSVMTYDDDRNTWKIPHAKHSAHIRAEVLKQAKNNVYEEHLKFISTFDEKWRMDENIILIMCAIVLFTPTRQRIIHSDVIRLEQNSYYYLLRRYLESVYPGCEAKSAFIKLIQKIADVERLNQVIIGVYLNVNPAEVEPLLREIFDLKNH